MPFVRIARSLALNMAGSAGGLLSTLLIVWEFGLGQFASYTIAFAKLSIILFGTELVPSAFALFRVQQDREFEVALPSFFLLFATAGGLAAWAVLALGLVDEPSWAMIVFVVLSTTQNYLTIQTQAQGHVGALYWLPPISSGVRLLLLLLLTFGAAGVMSVSDILWTSLAAGMAVSQLWLLYRYAELRRELPGISAGGMRYLWRERRRFYAYYPNAFLKRLRDIFLPLFCDIAPIDKTDAGRFFVFYKALEAVCMQVRVLEGFMVNRTVRAGLQHLRLLIFWTSTLAGHAAVVVLSLVLIYPHGIDWTTVALAAFIGMFLYPYVFELLRRMDALAAFDPRRVTKSLTAFLLGMAVTLVIASALGWLGIATLMLSLVLGQTLAALTYLLPSSTAQPLETGSQPPPSQ